MGSVASCAYEGFVRHRRYEPASHELRKRIFMLYLDLDELPELFDGYSIASARGRALVEFRRSDFLGDPRRPLADEVRGRLIDQSGGAPAGAVRLRANVRNFGHVFNPAAFYYCFGADDRVESVVAEVTNTPWGERHAYVLAPETPRPPNGVLRGQFQKEFHVSPFMGMDQRYTWRLTEPGQQLVVHIASEQNERTVFDATLSLRRRTLTPASLTRLLAAHPLLGWQILGTIYWHGLRLWSKRVPHFPNPSGAPVLRRRGTRG